MDEHIIRYLGACGVVASQLMNLSVIPSLLDIISEKSTLSYPTFPIVMGLTNAIHNIFYALSRGNQFVLYSSLMSLALNSIFLAVHGRFSKSRSSIGRELLYFPVFTTAISLSLIASGTDTESCMHLQLLPICLEKKSNVLGIISTVVATVSYCGQLSTFHRIVRTKNSASISPWMTAGVLLRASCWFVYSYLIGDMFYLTSTSIGLLSAAIQISLLILYPSRISNKLD